jgi:uncharacterized protein (TIGR03437 family)
LPIIFQGGLVNSASYAVSPTPLSPGALVSVFGQGIAGAGGSAVSNPLPTSLGGVSVTMGGIPAPLLAAGGDQVNLQVPYGLNTQLSADVVFNVNGVLSPVQNVVIGTVPAAFTTDEMGTMTAVLHTSTIPYTPVTPANPAVAGEILAIFANGLGPLVTPIADGTPATATDAASGTVLVTIGMGPQAQTATVQYAGLATGFAGLYQINVMMPSVPSGAYPLIISVNGIASTGSPTIPVQ